VLKFSRSPLIKALLRSLQPPLFAGDVRNAPVLTNSRGERIRHYQDGWELALKKAGVPDMRFHDLRHSFGTVTSETESPAAVSKAMGHSPTRMTEGYVALAAAITAGPLGAANDWLANVDISAANSGAPDEA